MCKQREEAHLILLGLVRDVIHTARRYIPVCGGGATWESKQPSMVNQPWNNPQKKKKKQLRGKKNEDRNSREDRANFTPDAAIKKELPKEELPK